MEISKFVERAEQLGIEYYTGVPDSQLKALCDYLMSEFGVGTKHVVAANEGAATALAAGHYLATGKPAMIYMQNSGIGNAVNPICSLLNDKVYAIPALFVIGWRGEPGIHDEPQHIFQGEITCSLLECLDIAHFVLEKDTTEEQLAAAFEEAKVCFEKGKCYALVVRKGALANENKTVYKNNNALTREEIVKYVIGLADSDDIFVSTTGKLSRELFEARASKGQGHEKDFLTVGSMGHASMIAAGIASAKPARKVICMDGDGAVLMHMGSLAVLGALQLNNFVHIMINNGAHETVGGIPTVSDTMDYKNIAISCGFKNAYSVKTKEEIKKVFSECGSGPSFIEIKANLISRADLGRPTTTPIENRDAFMKFIGE